MRHRIVLFTLFAVMIAAPLAAQVTELPVRKVVLYKHGVGFFERSAEVDAGSAIRLRFKAEEMGRRPQVVDRRFARRGGDGRSLRLE